MFLKRAFTRDRRRKKRQLLNTSVPVFTETGRIEAIGINVSEVGMCLFTVADLPVDSQLEVELPVPGSNELVRFSAVVRHRALYLYGVEFVERSDVPAAREVAAPTAQVT